jgi:hypothetical protein
MMKPVVGATRTNYRLFVSRQLDLVMREIGLREKQI